MLNTIKISRVNFIILLFIILGNFSYSYEIQEQGINSSISESYENWSVTHYFPSGIIIIRNPNENTGNISIELTGNLIKVSNSIVSGNSSYSIAFLYQLDDSSNDIEGSFTSTSSSGGESFTLNGPSITNEDISFSLNESPGIIDTITVSGTMQIIVPLTLEDGVYNLDCLLVSTPGEYGPRFSRQSLPITIVTTPVVQVDDIDFGRQIKGVGPVVRTGNITVTGKEGAELTYTLDTSGEFVQAGGESTIPFTSEIIAGGSSKIVDGESTATLQVTANISDNVDSGNYTGSVRVLVQHN